MAGYSCVVVATRRALLVASFVALLAEPPAARAGIWEDVAASGARASSAEGDEASLRAALLGAPDDSVLRRALAELLSVKKRSREAAHEFEMATRVAPTTTDEARAWFRLGNERTRLGAYDEALDAYERELALGDGDPAALANSAELLMEKGQTREAIHRYQEAVTIEEREANRREHLRSIALGYFGLAVALDRASLVIASREAIARALALDPGLAMLRSAGQPDSDVFFVPRGEVHYYLALSREAQGRVDDAAVAFRDYLRVATGPYLGRAREHLAQLMAEMGRVPPPQAPSPQQGSGNTPRVSNAGDTGWRVLHQATVFTDGPLVAPLIDAAWRLYPRLLEPCLRDIPPPGSSGSAADAPGRQVKIVLEMRIEESGRVGAVTAKAPVELGEGTSDCIEAALLKEFRVSRPARRRATLVRTELILAPAPPGGV